MEVSENIYFWLSNLGLLKRPAVYSKIRTFLGKEDILLFESGKSMIDLIEILYPKLATLTFQEGSSISSRTKNWNTIFKALESIGISTTPNLRSTLIKGNNSAIVHLIEKIKDTVTKDPHDTELILNEINPEKEFEFCRSPLEFLILSACKAFQITPKQAAGLFSQNGRLLEKLVSKGFKGNFDTVFRWYTLIQLNLDKLFKLIAGNKESLQIVLNTLKYGITSSDKEIARKTVHILIEFKQSDMFSDEFLWNWFAGSKLMNTSISIFTPELSDCIVRMMYDFGRNNIYEVFCEQLVRICADEFYKICVYMIRSLVKVLHLGTRIREVIDYWIQICLREFQDINNTDERVSSAMVLSELLEKFPKFISTEQSELILSVISKEINKKKVWYKIALIGRLFEVLSNLTKQNHKHGLSVYFMLIKHLSQSFHNSVLREFYLKNFMMIYDKHFISISVLLNHITKLYTSLKDINTFDFQFIIRCGYMHNLSPKHASLLLEILGKIYIGNSTFGDTSERPLVALISRFGEHKQVNKFVQNYLRTWFKISLSKKEHSSLKPILTDLSTKIIDLEIPNLSEKVSEIVLEFSSPVASEVIENAVVSSKLSSLTLVQLSPSAKSSIKSNLSRTPVKSSNTKSSIYSLVHVPEGRAMQDIRKAYMKHKEIEKRSQSEKRSFLKNKSTLKTFILQNNESKFRKMPLKETELVDIDEIPEDEKERIQEMFERHSKTTKGLFGKYTYSEHAYRSVDFFANYNQKYLNEGELIKLLRDNKIDKSLISTERIKDIWSLMILRHDPPLMDYEDFLNFMFQIAMYISRKDSTRDLSELPLSVSLEAFLDSFAPKNGTSNKKVDKLNETLSKNPESELPSGFKKVKEKKIIVSYEIPTQIETLESVKICLEILDSILSDAFGTHFLYPYVKAEEIVKAKENSYRTTRKLTNVKLSPETKNGYFYLTKTLPEQESLEIALLIDDLIYSVHEGSSVLISRNRKTSHVHKFIEKDVLSELKRKKRTQELNQELIKIKEVKLKQLDEVKSKKEEEEKREKEKKKIANMKVITSTNLLINKFNSKTPKLTSSSVQHTKNPHINKLVFQKAKETLKNIELAKLKEKEEIEKKAAESFLSQKRRQTVLQKQLEATKKEVLVEELSKNIYSQAWKDEEVQKVFSLYDNSLSFIFDYYLKLSTSNEDSLLYPGLVKFINQFNVSPSLMHVDLTLKIFNAITKNLGRLGLPFVQFKEFLLRVAIVGKDKVESSLQKTLDSPAEQIRGLLEWMAIPLEENKVRDYLKLIQLKYSFAIPTLNNFL